MSLGFAGLGFFFVSRKKAHSVRLPDFFKLAQGKAMGITSHS